MRNGRTLISCSHAVVLRSDSKSAKLHESTWRAHLAGYGIARVVRVQPGVQRRQGFKSTRHALPGLQRRSLPPHARLQDFCREDVLV